MFFILTGRTIPVLLVIRPLGPSTGHALCASLSEDMGDMLREELVILGGSARAVSDIR